MVRRAWRSAQRLGAELDVLWVADHDPTAEDQEQLDALRQLASVLGAHLLVEHGDDVAAVAQRVAQDRGTTYVLIGTPEPRSALRRLTKPALPDRLLSAASGSRPADRGRPDPAYERRPVMTAVLIVVVAILAVALVALGVALASARGLGPFRRPGPVQATSSRRILFPFVAGALSQRALDAALRLARSDGATLVPVFLARVSLDLPLDSALPRQCSLAMPLLEAIEQRATEAGVPVDSRIERGRNRRHALRQAIAEERFDRIVIAAASEGSPGFDADDVAWLLDNAPGEIVVLRPRRRRAVRTRRCRPGSRSRSPARPPRARRGEHAISRGGETAVSR